MQSHVLHAANRSEVASLLGFAVRSETVALFRGASAACEMPGVLTFMLACRGWLLRPVPGSGRSLFRDLRSASMPLAPSACSGGSNWPVQACRWRHRHPWGSMRAPRAETAGVHVTSGTRADPDAAARACRLSEEGSRPTRPGAE